MSSEQATLEHKQMVNKYITLVVKDLLDRAVCHDNSKLESVEIELFDEYTPKLKDTTYGSEQYKEYLLKLKPALDHHYAVNKHHPEHYPNGIKDMDLIDLIEMMADWKAASLRHQNGNILLSIEDNKKRFNYGDELANIFRNTVRRFE